MSVDTFDMSQQTTRVQHGLQQSFFPIIIDATLIAPGTEIEVNINPCDHIWMPTFYDPSLGLNPGQSTQVQNMQFLGPDPQSPYTPGLNVFDVIDTFDFIALQTATIFSLRFNSPSAPWLLWGLNTMLSFASSGIVCGQGDTMRSISGPISRMWFKKLIPASASVSGLTNALDRIVLMSSLGFSQQTVGTQANIVNGNPGTEQGQLWGYSVNGGGYQTPQLNTYEQLKLQTEHGLSMPGSRSGR